MKNAVRQTSAAVFRSSIVRPSSRSRRRHKRCDGRQQMGREPCPTRVPWLKGEGDQRIYRALHWITPRNNDPRLTPCTDQGGPVHAHARGPIEPPQSSSETRLAETSSRNAADRSLSDLRMRVKSLAERQLLPIRIEGVLKKS